MIKVFFVVSIFLLALFVILAIEFRCLGKKAKFLLPKFSMFPREEQKLYDLDRIVLEASDICITFAFYVLIACGLALDYIFLSIAMYILLIAWAIKIFTLSPKELYSDYRKAS